MTTAQQALSHVAAHASQADHADVHGFSRLEQSSAS
jgi:hypothetical protein